MCCQMVLILLSNGISIYSGPFILPLSFSLPLHPSKCILLDILKANSSSRNWPSSFKPQPPAVVASTWSASTYMTHSRAAKRTCVTTRVFPELLHWVFLGWKYLGLQHVLWSSQAQTAQEHSPVMMKGSWKKECLWHGVLQSSTIYRLRESLLAQSVPEST